LSWERVSKNKVSKGVGFSYLSKREVGKRREVTESKKICFNYCRFRTGTKIKCKSMGRAWKFAGGGEKEETPCKISQFVPPGREKSS